MYIITLITKINKNLMMNNQPNYFTINIYLFSTNISQLSFSLSFILLYYNHIQNYFFNKPLVTTCVGLLNFSVPGKS